MQLLHCLGGAASQVGTAVATAAVAVVVGGAGAGGSLSSATGRNWVVSRTAVGQDVKVLH